MRVLTVLFLTLVGCAADNGEGTDPAATAVSDPAAQAVEVACGACIYKMDGVTSCELATKVDGKPMLVKGLKDDAHSLGLCGAAKEAHLVGHVEGDHFAATKIDLAGEGGW